jgi:hypothetical protein
VKRTVEVEVSGLIRMEIDDEAISDWDGRKLLEIHERSDLSEWPQRQVLAAMAYSIGVLGSHDGYADFPDDAIQAWDFVDGPEFDTVTLDGQVLR